MGLRDMLTNTNTNKTKTQRQVKNASKTKTKKKNADNTTGTVEKETRNGRPVRANDRNATDAPESTANSQQRIRKKNKKATNAEADAKLKAYKANVAAATAAAAAIGAGQTPPAPSPDTASTAPLVTPPDHKRTVCEDEAGAAPVPATVPLKAMSKEKEIPPPPSKENVSTKIPKAATGELPASVKSAATQQSTVSVTDKWPAEDTARKWMEKVDFPKVKTEFEKLQKMTVNIEKDCKKWKAHPKSNQSEDYPALDANLVKVEGVEYTNMSVVEVPLHRNVLVAQIPTAGNEEAFWKAVFELRATSMHLLVGDEPHDFFPTRSNDFSHYGQMFVNNRRVETVNEDVMRFAIEVLPSGFSNSIICNVTVIKNWNIDTVHAKYAVVVKETIELNNFLSTAASDETALVVSKHGAGRPGFFLSLTVAVTKMDQKSEPQIADIVKAIRAQRPKAVETLTQYASLYISLFYYIKRKCTSKGVDDAMNKKSVALTAQFTTALMAEVAAAAGRSTMTMPTK